MQMIGQRNIHHIHIRAADEVFVVFKAVRRVDAVGLLRILQRRRLDVAHRNQFHILTGGNAGQMYAAADVADANAADADLLHKKALL